MYNVRKLYIKIKPRIEDLKLALNLVGSKIICYNTLKKPVSWYRWPVRVSIKKGIDTRKNSYIR